MYVQVVKIPQICMYVNKKILHKIYICMFRQRDTLDVRVCSKKIPHKIYICMFRQKDTLDMHVCKQKILHKIYICMFRQKDTLDMHVYSKNTLQNIYMYVQVARYLGYACIQQKYLTKIYTCLGSKIPHEKKRKKNKTNKKKK